jgi:hypothetical protein
MPEKITLPRSKKGMPKNFSNLKLERQKLTLLQSQIRIAHEPNAKN